MALKEIQKWYGSESLISGIIYDIPYKQNEKYEYTIKLDFINQEKVKPFLLSLTTDSALETDIHSKITTKIALTSPPPYSKAYYKSRNIFICGNLNKEHEYKVENPKNKNLHYYILKLRQSIISTPKEFLNPDISNLINAILIGEKTSLSKNIKNNFKKIGVYHLLATSGMHIAVISQFIFYLLKKIKIKEKYSALISAITILIFMAVAGFTPSVTRAATMSIIYFIGLFISRKSDPLNSLGIAVLIICGVNRFAACDIGLWLSFLATLGIILCHGQVKNLICEKLKINKNYALLEYIISIVSATVCAFVFTLPVIILYFKKISILSPLSNLIFIPGVSAVLNLSLIANILKIINLPNAVINPLVMACGYMAYALIKISETLAKIPYASISLKYQEAYIWLIVTILLTAFTAIFKPNKKYFWITALISLNTALFCFLLHQVLNYDKLSVSFTPCGEGICMTISKNNHRAIIMGISENSRLENIYDSISDSYVKDIDYLNLYVDKNSYLNVNTLKKIIKEYPPSNVVMNPDNILKLDSTSPQIKTTYYKSNIKTILWGDVLITNLKIKNHTYMKVETNNLIFLIFPNGGNAQDLPNDWKVCDFIIANGLPINYLLISFKKVIISEPAKNALINIAKLKHQNKSAHSLYHEGTLNINLSPNGNYKLRRLA